MILNTKIITSAEELDSNISFLGTCKRVEVYRGSTVFIGAEPDKDKLKERTEHLRGLQEDKSLSDKDRDFIKTRLSRIAGGVAVIRVGGSTELEVKEKLDRVEDALNATQAAAEEGILPGGGSALVQASVVLDKKDFNNPDFEAGISIVKNACESPLKQIVKNAGGSPEVVLEKVKQIPNNMGYDVRKEEYVDMLKSGIIDPLKVVRTALEHANSAACNLISVGCAIVEDVLDSEEVETLIEK